MKRHWKWFAGGLALVALALAGRGVWEARSLGFLRWPVFETERPQLPPLPRPALLVFSKTNSYIHKEAIPAAKAFFQELAAERGWSLFLTDSGAVFNTEDLAHFDAVVWNNVTGDVLLPEQRQAMRAWLEQGRGYVGLHSAGDGSHEAWPWYQDTVIRARFTGHPLDPQLQRATVRIEPPRDPIVTALGETWSRVDEWYSFEKSPRAPDLRVLATLDESSYAPGSFFGTPLRMGADHPVIWKHCVGRGRVFYSALGHTAGSYAEPQYRDVLARAVAWAGGIAAVEIAPRALPCESR